MKIQLTKYSRFCGCGAKMPPGTLDSLLSMVPFTRESSVVVGIESRDDAGVYKISKTHGWVFTADVITPVDNRAEYFGAIAAANALSDIYAMGGTPIMALNILGFPLGELPESIASRILDGGRKVLQNAHCAILGGHTLNDKELKYGLAVMGRVKLPEMMRNSLAKPGDVLLLTKPIGSGILVKALKDEKIEESLFHPCRRWMMELNQEASRLAVETGIRAATDVTGFGLLGHLYLMARASRVDMYIESSQVPVLDGVWAFVEKGWIPSANNKNLEFVRPHLVAGKNIPPEMLYLLCDAQTSGGLLFSVPSVMQRLARLKKKFVENHVFFREIGWVGKGCGKIHVL